MPTGITGATGEQTVLTYDGLVYYDGKIKDYIAAHSGDVTPITTQQIDDLFEDVEE